MSEGQITLSQEQVLKKAKFDDKVNELKLSKKVNCKFFTRDEIAAKIAEIQEAKLINTKKSSKQYHLLKKYDVLTIGE